MRTFFVTATLLLAGPAPAQSVAQSAPQTAPSSGSDLTRMLNGAPPATGSRPAAPTTTAPAVPATRPSSAPATTPQPSEAVPRPAPPLNPTPRPVTPPATTAPAPATPASAPPVPASPPTVLNPAAVAALPFTAELPTGFQITTGRPGPDFRVYTIRRGAQPFVMIYAGPSSQFPIYSGETVLAAGRASIVTVEGGRRRALEHLFQRGAAPQEVHVWVSSLEGADRAIAERIAQSVDVP